MKSYIRYLLTPPTFDDDNQTRTARLLHTILIAFLIFFSILSVISIPTANSPLLATIVLFSFVAILFGTLLCLKRGYIRSISRIFVAILWLLLTGVNIIFGGTLNPGIQHYATLTLVAGLLINTRAAIIVALMGALAGWGFHVAEMQDWLPQSQLNPTSFDRALSLTTSLVMTAMLLYLALNSIERALKRARCEIAERERVQAVLEEERNLLRTLIDNMPDLIYVKDLESRFILTNTAHIEFMGQSSMDDVLGTTDVDHFAAQHAAQYLADEQKLIADGQPIINKEEPIINRALHVRWQMTTKVPLLDNTGTIIGLVGISRDITKLKKAEAQRMQVALERKRVELLKEFVDNVSHDLKTPLTVIKTSMYLLEHWDDPVKQQEKLQAIKKQVNHLERLIENILTVSRLERLPDLQSEAFDLSLMTNEIINRFRPLAEARQITLTIKRPPILPPFVGDRLLVERAIINLVENAIHYSDDDGTVGVTITPTDETLMIAICDTGVGISQDELKHIFEPFYRTDRARTGTNGSAGLGLSIVQHAVEMHGGTIDVESTPGQGSTFTITLPINTD